MSAQIVLDSLRARDIVITLNGDNLKIDAPAGVLTDEDRQAVRDHKVELLALLTSRHLCPGCRGKLRLQDLARDTWWCPTCRRWTDGQGRSLTATETPKSVTRDEDDARKLIADLKAAGCAFVYEDSELRLQFPSRMSAGLWARFENAGDVFRGVAREAAVCDESINDEDSRETEK